MLSKALLIDLDRIKERRQLSDLMTLKNDHVRWIAPLKTRRANSLYT